MPIEYLETNILFEDADRRVALTPNLSPQGSGEKATRTRNAYFPGLALLPSGDLLALFVISEAFESAEATTYVARSGNLGRSWDLEGALRDLAVSEDDSNRTVSDYSSEVIREPGSPVVVRSRAGPHGAANMNSGYRVRSLEGGGPIDRPPNLTSDYLKPTVLRGGTVVAIGYRFERRDPAAGISIEETGGIQPGEDIVSFSPDEGKTWTPHRVILRIRPELYEISGPCVELGSGDLVAVAAPFRMPDGGNPSGQLGILLRSRDKGRTWTDDEIFFRSPDGNMTPYESRICEMQPGRLVAIVWAYDTAAERHHPNQIAVSHDDGGTWSSPVDTAIWGQASNLIWVGGDRLMTIHAHRGENPGIFVRLVDFSGDVWKPLEEAAIYGAGSPVQTKPGQGMAEMFASLKFGQPSLLPLPDGEILAAHWTEEEGLGKIRIHRLRLR